MRVLLKGRRPPMRGWLKRQYDDSKWLVWGVAGLAKPVSRVRFVCWAGRVLFHIGGSVLAFFVGLGLLVVVGGLLFDGIGDVFRISQWQGASQTRESKARTFDHRA